MKNKNNKHNKKLRNFVWTISGILLMAIFVVAITSISDTGITTTGTITAEGNSNISNGAMFINATSGNVGINTSSPSSTLEVNGFTNAKGFNNKLMRANDSVFETTINGTEYFSPNQYGGFYGTVFIKLFNFNVIVGGGTEQIAHGVTGVSNMISLRGSVQITNLDFLPIPHSSTVLSPETFQIMTRIAGSNIEILSGSARITPDFRIESGTIRFEYTK